MLTHLLSTHPRTSTATLELLLNNPDVPAPARVAAANHPNLPATTTLPHDLPLGRTATIAILTNPRTTPERRAHVIGAMSAIFRNNYLRARGELTTQEITAILDAGTVISPAALAVNPHTPTRHRQDALRTIATQVTSSNQALEIALLVDHHRLDATSRTELGELLATRMPHDATLSYFAEPSTVNPVTLALRASTSLLRQLIESTGSVELSERALRIGEPVTWSVARALDRYAPEAHPDLRDLLAASMPRDDERALRHLRYEQNTAHPDHPGDAYAARTYLVGELTTADLLPATLRTIAQTLTSPGITPDDALPAVLLHAVAHPATPRELLPTLAEHIAQLPPPAPGLAAHELTTYAIAYATLTGQRHPGLAASIPQLTHVVGDTGHVNTHHVRTALEAHPSWPLTPDATRGLLELEPTFHGTLRDLLAVLDAITA